MPIDWFPLWLSLRVAFVSTALSLAAGLWLAYILANRNFRGKEALDAAVTLPLVLPPTVLGYYPAGGMVTPALSGNFGKRSSAHRWYSRGKPQ